MPAEWKSYYGEWIYAKSHGFEGEIDEAQLGAWVTIIAMFGAWFALYAYMLPFPAAAICTAIFVILGATTIVLKIFLTLSDNVDEGVYQEKVPYTAITGDPPEGKRPCYFCHRFVDKNSKHCIVCDRCCVGFDHHCRWLNMCVGGKNYHQFFSFMCFSACSIGFMFIVGLLLLVRCGTEKEFCRAQLYQAWGTSSLAAYYVIMSLLMIYQFVGLLLLGNLIGFHIYLFFTDQTTYKWIKQRRERKKEIRFERERRGLDPNPPYCGDPLPERSNEPFDSSPPPPGR